jgi:hypothetical protein
MTSEAVYIGIIKNPKTGECCVVDKATIPDLALGAPVTWSAETVSGSFKIVFPDTQVFGEEVFYLDGGTSVTKEVVGNPPPGLTQDYVIFCIQTGKKVMTEDGISPTIIIGG